MDDQPSAPDLPRAPESVGERVLTALAGAGELLMVYLGDRLGLYRALAERGPFTPAELADAVGIAEPYAREWLAQQSRVDLVAADDSRAPAEPPRYRLAPADAVALTDPEDPAYIAPVARLLPALVRVLPSLLAACRTGDGVPYVDYGADAREALSDLAGPRLLERVPAWIAALPELDSRLRAKPIMRVADLGCGPGWTAIAIAAAYPNAQVEGFDSDEASIDLARANARRAGVAGRVRFHVRDPADPALGEGYDLVWALASRDARANAVARLASMRRLATGGEPGAVVLASPRAPAEADPDGSLSRLLGAASLLLLLPVALAEQPAVGSEVDARADALHSQAEEAGFRGIEPVPVEDALWRLHLLRA